MSSRFVATAAVALAAGLAAGGCGNSGDGPAATGDADLAATSPGKLFAANATGGTLRRVRGRVHRLTFSGLRAVTVFTDRPARKAGVESSRQFVRRWRGRGFSADPPNAAIAISGARRGGNVKVLELRHPRLSRRGTLVFTAIDLGDSASTALSSFGDRADRRVPRRFGHASLFVDPSGATAGPQAVTFGLTQSNNAGPSTQIDFDDDTIFMSRVRSGPGGAVDVGETQSGTSLSCSTAAGSGSCRVTTNLTLLPGGALPITGTATVPAGSTLTAVYRGKTVTLSNGPFALR